ncbi:MAG: PilZ domain-containing protein [Nitrospira sp.]|nr:PilZ domain-containing protein [Nitrospira sp.]
MRASIDGYQPEFTLLAPPVGALLQYGALTSSGLVTMPFAQRYHYRFPVFIPVRYERGNGTGYGSVTNLSRQGWRLSGSLPLELGALCSLNVRLPTMKVISVAEGKVRWICGDECGIETLVMDPKSQERLNAYIQDRVKAL